MSLKIGRKISDFDQVTTNIQNTRKLFRGRIDLTVQSKDTLEYTCKEAGLDAEKTESVFILDKKSLYYAFHGNTSDSVITLLQETFIDMRINGVVSDVFRKYGK